jgi:hypothetical protein
LSSLKPQGILLIRTPNAANPLSFRALYADLTHETSYTENSLEDLLKLSGFSLVKTIGVRAYNSEDKLSKKIMKGAFLLPASWALHTLLRIMYLSEGGAGGIVNRDILAVGRK